MAKTTLDLPPLVRRNPDEERELTLPAFPYEKDEKNGENIVNLSFLEDVARRNAALVRISEELPEIYNTWMLPEGHELAYAFTPMFYQAEKTVEDGGNESVCSICSCTDGTCQLGVYTFPFHCRPKRQRDHWDALYIKVCLDCFFISGHLFPTWSRGKDAWDAMDGWEVTVEDDIAPMLRWLQENCDAFAAGEAVEPNFDPRWIGYLEEMEDKERFVPQEEDEEDV